MRNLFKRGKRKMAANKQKEDKQQQVMEDTAESQKTSQEPDGIQGKLLVMGQESTFSSEVVDYAIDMAQRMSFEILALNSAPLPCDSLGRFSTSRNKLCDEFQSISKENVAAFRQNAESNKIPFTHVVKFDDPEQALSSVQREYGKIEFVISDSPQASAVNRAANSNRPRSEVLVYSMI
jgi:hypothetical protein